MIPQDKNQPGPPGVVKTFGHPWHGLVEDGTLTLPNAATMPYPAPTAAGEADVLAFRVPGTPPVTRTPEQAAADAAAGRQWLDYALISGRSTRRLYGQAIGGNGSWLYAAPDGSRWLVTLADVPGTHDLTTAWTATLTCARFGEIGGTPETHTLTATLSDWQQDIPGHPGGDYAIDGKGVIESAYLFVEDVLQDGSGAILMIALDAEDLRGAFHNQLLLRPLGFIEITLSGTPGIDASCVLLVVRNRGDTLGAVSYSDVYPTIFYLYGEDYAPPGSEPYVWTTLPLGDGDAAAYSALVGNTSSSGSVADRIIALLYDASGQIVEITINTEYSTTLELPMPANGTGGTRTSVAVSSGSVTLSGPAGSITILMSISQETTCNWGGSPAIQSEINTAWSIGPDSGSSSNILTSAGAPRPAEGYAITGAGGSNFGFIQAADGYAVDFMQCYVTSGIVPSTEWIFGLIRYSSTAFELYLARREFDALPSNYSHIYQLGAVGKSSAGGSVIDEEIGYPYIRGSAHPVTGEIARARDVPVCWV